ncbi:phytoene desaturase family protein [Bacillus sp. REN16]|uniref:phytoene desaturase family protein n=1 Tax=Bacillus sp. REN16 TaxID=2887296 RepID=UPI001E5C81A6|nr:FAD-dependent oxidoreductase [Bacillus sp. REN16]MCC3357835.1 FAD-dependent oxidoreductase [Bacillus sp. REN16]
MEKVDVAIVGSGLAGLTAANYLAKEGKNVIIFEKANRLGGRSMTHNVNGALFNIGAHALYKGGEAMTIFKELGVEISGKNALIQTHGIWKNKVIPFATGIGSLLSSPLFSWSEKFEFTQLIIQIWKMNIDKIMPVSIRDWAEKEIKSPMIRHHFYALCRTATYTHAPELQQARAVLRQLQRSLKTGVIYVDGGWETIVSDLRKKAENLGVKIRNHSRVESVENRHPLKTIHFANGETIDAENVILAVPPNEACRLIENSSLSLWKEQAVPITASALDLCLTHLPNPDHQFVLGLDQPIFFTNESRAAKVCKKGNVVVHVVRYHDPSCPDYDPHANKEQMEETMDLLHPGWRNALLTQQFLPKITVVYDFPRVDRLGPAGPEVPSTQGLYIAGDWASHEELLADGAVASGKRAAAKILEKSKILV